MTELLLTEPVYVDPFNVIVRVRPFSTATVVTVTDPFELSSVALSTAPHENAVVAIADILGGVVSMTKSLLAARELASPRAGSVNVAGLPAISLIEPPLRASADVEA